MEILRQAFIWGIVLFGVGSAFAVLPLGYTPIQGAVGVLCAPMLFAVSVALPKSTFEEHTDRISMWAMLFSVLVGGVSLYYTIPKYFDLQDAYLYLYAWVFLACAIGIVISFFTIPGTQETKKTVMPVTNTERSDRAYYIRVFDGAMWWGTFIVLFWFFSVVLSFVITGENIAALVIRILEENGLPSPPDEWKIDYYFTIHMYNVALAGAFWMIATNAIRALSGIPGSMLRVLLVLVGIVTVGYTGIIIENNAVGRNIVIDQYVWIIIYITTIYTIAWYEERKTS